MFSRIHLSRLHSRLPLLLTVTLLSLLLAACRESAQPTATPPPDSAAADVTVNLTLVNNPAQIGTTSLLLTFTDAAGNPVEPTAINVRGDMNHAGMAPVIRETFERTDAGYVIPFEWTMGGDWILTVAATLADGSTINQSFDVQVAGDGG